MYYDVLISGSKFHGSDALTYQSQENLKRGQLVSVNVRGRLHKGIVNGKVNKPSFKTTELTKAHEYTLPEASMQLFDWVCSYYPSPLGPILDLFVPPGKLANQKPKKHKLQSKTKKELPALNKFQQNIMSSLRQNSSSPVMIHGDTGTGKTRIYLERAKEIIESGRSVMMLVPEIGLTELLRDRFSEYFNPEQIVVTHSGLSPNARQRVWKQLASNIEPMVIIGTRSALFAPVSSLGLIIMDEAHDTAYKQEQLPNYQSTRVAAKLTQIHGCQLIMGSATPLVADYYTFKQKGLPIERIKQVAIKSDYKTNIKIVDIKDKSMFTKSKDISTEMLDKIGLALKNNEQSLIFLNRRGNARLVLCDDCGWQAMCPNCDVALVYHADKHRMLCHSCGYYQKVPNTCPECHSANLIYTVAGTKNIELELAKHFPDATIKRFDRDTSAEGRIDRVFADIESGKIDILVGTQGIVKGFDLPKLSVVGVIHADSGLQIADYRSSEHTYQLISQVSGRLGRGYRDGTLVLQTYNPSSDLLSWAINKDYDGFYQHEIKHRTQYLFPPSCYLLKIVAKRASADSCQDALNKLKLGLKDVGGLQVTGPTPSYPEKQAGKYRWQLIVKSKNRKKLVQAVKTLSGNYTHDLDPNSLL